MLRNQKPPQGELVVKALQRFLSGLNRSSSGKERKAEKRSKIRWEKYFSNFFFLQSILQTSSWGLLLSSNEYNLLVLLSCAEDEVLEGAGAS